MSTIFWQAQSKTLPNQGGVDVQFKGMISAFVQTMKVNGVTGLWRGLTANLLKVREVLILEFSNRILPCLSNAVFKSWEIRVWVTMLLCSNQLFLSSRLLQMLVSCSCLLSTARDYSCSTMVTLSHHFLMFPNLMWIRACRQMNYTIIFPKRKGTTDDPRKNTSLEWVNELCQHSRKNTTDLTVCFL